MVVSLCHQRFEKRFAQNPTATPKMTMMMMNTSNLVAAILNSLTRDFWLGVTVTVGVVAMYQLYQALLGGPTLVQMQAIANAPVRHAGDDDDTITIFGMTDANNVTVTHKGIPDYSPFCARVELYLRFMHQPYVKSVSRDFAENPRHKIPFANVFGEMVDNSSHIIDTIQRKLHWEDDDERLTAAQRTTGHFVRTILFQDYYFCLMHAMANTAWGHNVVRTSVKKEVPPIPLLRRFIFKAAIRNDYAITWGQGYGRYPEVFVVRQAMRDFQALSHTLGNHKFILDTPQPTRYDIDMYAFLSACFIETAAVPPLPWIGVVKKQYPNLVQHTMLMKQILYPELAKEVEGEYLAEEAS